ncbi:arginine--tRNA ligase [Bacillus sp. 31A1R]|uniref:Arginine--tRNA ligase n=1 Tax=Robertmurraya mangrovi TaxID=3098077 RepID=A0ABU5J448_9BACI|nr:arginine--tRNA ligase [Bacillus sp. 31A1R]MDZ5474201.1 arginine--tRNA ligase [Bacillus sp. 31A1R]
MNFKAIFSSSLHDALENALHKDQIESLIEIPKSSNHGDLAFPCFTLAKQLRKSPAFIAEEVAKKINSDWIKRAEAVGPYVNVFFNKSLVSSEILKDVLSADHNYGSSTIGSGKNIVLDFSSPNIAKPFSMGHLRSTVIGNALSNIANQCGYNTFRINHLGDWGTQFGKLITAYKKWGEESKVAESPIQELFKLYIKFHEEVENQPELDDEARKWFKELENGNEEATKLWSLFRSESLKEFQRIYDLLGIQFDSFNGEAFYNDKMEAVVEQLASSHLLEASEGAEVVRLDDQDLPPCLIRKSDGASLYATRDLAAGIYRKQQYDFFKALYIVGQEQTVHFKQVKGVLKKLGYDWADQMEHIPFGLYLKDGKKMSTRKGRVVLLEDVLKEAIELAQKSIEEKNPQLTDKESIAKDVGVGAVLFHDLKNDRMNNIEFSLEDMLTFEGETGPYLQYSNARAHSLLRKAEVQSIEAVFTHGLDDSYSWEVIKLINECSAKMEKSFELLSPSVLAKYLIDLAQAFNKFYAHVKVLEKTSDYNEKLALVKAVTIVLTKGLNTLGMGAPKQM